MFVHVCDQITSEKRVSIGVLEAEHLYSERKRTDFDVSHILFVCDYSETYKLLHKNVINSFSQL